MDYADLFYALLVYWFIVLILERHGLLERYGVSLLSPFVPILMLRTTRGQGLLTFLARPKIAWRLFANIGILLMLAGMLVMLLLLLLSDYLMLNSIQAGTTPPPGKFNEPQNIFLIPGINDFIPLTWGIIGLAVTLVVHEFAHAILCKVEGVTVKSMGILYAIVPIGGFAEPDEEQLGVKEPEAGTAVKTVSRSGRMRILSAGVTANFATALVAFALFFMLLGSISPIGDVMVTEVLPGSPAEAAGVHEGMLLTQADGQVINSAHDFFVYMNSTRPSNVTLSLRDNRVRKEVTVQTGKGVDFKGVNVHDIVPGSPAEAAGVKKGSILVRINDTQISNITYFMEFMNSTVPGQTIQAYFIETSPGAEPVKYNITLAVYSGGTKGFIGVKYLSEEGVSSAIGIRIGEYPAKGYLHILKQLPGMLNEPGGWFILFALPMLSFVGQGFPGFGETLSQFYEPVGWAAPLGESTFWLANALLWIGWLNFYVGLFNSLPAVPMDGGHVFRDVISSILSRFFGNGERVTRISNRIVVLLALIIFLSFIFLFIAPYIPRMFGSGS
ncbi:MAG TPA: PDZ domain-containing protein [Candidatus Methanoperedenaceae archaeon]|nr:PDZ domain-containing protein [Candidatus Methanoperedenaceae archaeon]